MVKRGKASSKDIKPKSVNQKKGSKKSNNNSKLGARARIRHNKAIVAKACTDLGKKRVAVADVGNSDVDLEAETNSIDKSPMMLSPVRFEFGPGNGPVDTIKQNSLQKTPKTPRFQDFDSESRLESLPMDLLVKILCNLHHDQLRAVFHVSQKIRKAVIHARQWYFNYTTPDRTRQEMLRTMTPLPTDRWPFVGTGDEEVMRIPSPSTPKAPRHGPRPTSRFKLSESSKLQLFSSNSLQSHQDALCHLFHQKVYAPWCPNRVLFYEDELCQAVAQNKLR
ncbi:hypothetical protein Leryth_006989 [Lithospermum erythrorhizon]|nr:hypothetical protein Leryth_006989 [Lithospermum erythrorhizon]